MKTKLTPAGIVFMLLLGTTSLSQAQANDEQYLSSDPININGYVKEDLPPPTDAELESIKGELNKQRNAIVVTKEKKKKYDELSDSTEKLSEEMEDLIAERKEAQKKIDKYNKKIDCLTATGYKPGCDDYVKPPVQDKVSVQRAAPVQKVEMTPAVKKQDDSFGSEIKILPYTGLTTFMSENNNLESNIGAGIKVETNVDSRFSVGLGFNYTTMNTEDYGNNYGYMNSNYFGYYNSFYGAGGNAFGGRNIEYRNMNFNIYGKFFFLKNERFRPYAGAGIGYNRSTMRYSNNNAASSSFGGYGYGFNNSGYYGYNFGNEEVITSSVNAELMVGSEIVFTKMFGLNLELSYMRGLGSNLSTENGIDPFYAPDQQRLRDLSDELSSANIISLFAGMLVQF